MPSSPPSVRPMLAALLTVLLLTSSVLVSGPATLLPAAHAAPGALTELTPRVPSAPPPTAEDSPVSMDLVSLTPTSLAPGGTLEAQIDVTNTSSEPLPALTLELRTRTARVTDREVLSTWQSDTSAQPVGEAIASSGARDRLDPGESTVLTVQIDAAELGYSEAPYYWGTRRLALTVAAEEDPLATLRTFVVWRPLEAEDRITQSVLLPLASEDASAMVTDPEGFETSLAAGRLASVRELARREGVDWWMDPALLDPPRMPVDADGTSSTPPPTEAEDAQTIPEYAPEPRSAELATLLEDAADERTVLSMPYARSDTISLRAAGAEQLTEVVRERGDQAWEDSGIAPRGSALRVDGAHADADALEAVLAAGGTAAIVPSSSLRRDPSSSVTPSSVGVYPSTREEGDELTLLAPDPELSSEFSLLTGSSDAEQIRQRLLAETATIASEYTLAPRHLLISPSTDAVLDPAAAGAALDAMEEAPWLVSGSTSTLLDAADQQEWTGDPRSESGELYALGRIDPVGVHPSGPSETGSWEHLAGAEDPQLLDPAALTELQDAWTEVDTLATAMEDDAPLDAPRREILAGTSIRWRGAPEIPATRAQEASALSTALQDRIQVVPASGYNVISDAVSVPITISNGLDTPITVRIEVTSDKPLVQVGKPAVVEVPARGQLDAAVDVEAIANGSVTLTTVVTTTDGRPLTAPVRVPLTVNPSWENWTTLLLVIAMGLLVVLGVARARRTGAATRAPGFAGPEDPEELARSGRSTPDRAPGADPAPDPASAPTEEDRS
ncbi:DUF6049 family protein [Brachybacterium vulturis]|uniref:DUF6049 family protein n=1 Tax=Brachybacterium vulturis TaxID=2017484 RepID=UPI0037361934